jgi:hypothetical protein
MKRHSVIIFAVELLITLVFMGCGDPVLYNISIVNNSSKTVSYRYDGNSDTLASGDSRDYQVKAYTQEPSDISIIPAGTLTIKMSRKGEAYIFENIEPINLNVANTMPFPVTIKADYYIDADGAGKTELLIPEKSEKTEAKIYTSRPRFAISADYPVNSVKVEWEMKDNAINAIVK